MVIYSVTWMISKDLSKGKGRAKRPEHLTGFSVLCRNRTDAISCLDYHFEQMYPNGPFTIDDGEVILKRQVVDSRNFSFNYLLMDGMREPLIMSDLKSNFFRAHKIF